MQRAAFLTLGCKVNQYDTEVMLGMLKQAGYEIVPFDSEADVYIVNTCSVTHMAEKKSRQAIHRAKRLNSDAMIVVTGCYAQVAAEEIKLNLGADLLIGNQDRHKIVSMIEQVKQKDEPINAVKDIMHTNLFEDIPLFSAPGRTRAFLKIQEGCTNFCTYCIIPYTRGPLRSRSLTSISAETERLVNAGFNEIVLTGIHLGAYGRDFPNKTTLVDAVKTILQVKGITRVRLSSLESIEVEDELLDLMITDKRLCRHLHLPLQAGSDRMLKAMNRHYTAEEYAELLTHIRSKVPDIAISTDLIVGFPGETAEIFSEALKFVQRMEFARIHVFPYSKRKGTPAASYSNQVPSQVKKLRVQAVQEAAGKAARDFCKKFIGETQNVLFETYKNGVADGLTGNYIRVYVENEPDFTGAIAPVLLQENYLDGLKGKVVK